MSNFFNIATTPFGALHPDYFKDNRWNTALIPLKFLAEFVEHILRIPILGSIYLFDTVFFLVDSYISLGIYCYELVNDYFKKDEAKAYTTYHAGENLKNNIYVFALSLIKLLILPILNALTITTRLLATVAAILTLGQFKWWNAEISKDVDTTVDANANRFVEPAAEQLATTAEDEISKDVDTTVDGNANRFVEPVAEQLATTEEEAMEDDFDLSLAVPYPKPFDGLFAKSLTREASTDDETFNRVDEVTPEIEQATKTSNSELLSGTLIGDMTSPTEKSWVDNFSPSTSSYTF